MRPLPLLCRGNGTAEAHIMAGEGRERGNRPIGGKERTAREVVREACEERVCL